MPPTSRSAIPGRSALGGRAGTLGARSAIPARTDIGHCGKLKSGAVVLMRPCAGSGHSRCGAGADTESEPAIGINDARANGQRGRLLRAIRERGDSQSWIHRSGRLTHGPSWGQQTGEGAWHPGGGCVIWPPTS